jgi:hypothetical protein
MQLGIIATVNIHDSMVIEERQRAVVKNLVSSFA